MILSLSLVQLTACGVLNKAVNDANTNTTPQTTPSTPSTPSTPDNGNKKDAPTIPTTYQLKSIDVGGQNYEIYDGWDNKPSYKIDHYIFNETITFPTANVTEFQLNTSNSTASIQFSEWSSAVAVKFNFE